MTRYSDALRDQLIDRCKAMGLKEVPTRSQKYIVYLWPIEAGSRYLLIGQRGALRVNTKPTRTGSWSTDAQRFLAANLGRVV